MKYIKILSNGSLFFTYLKQIKNTQIIYNKKDITNFAKKSSKKVPEIKLSLKHKKKYVN